MKGIDIKRINDILGKYNSINYAFLFGSTLRKMHTASDIDILIGGKLSFTNRVNLASDLEILLKRKIDLIITQEASPILVLKALKEGRPVLIRNKDKLKDDYFNNFYKADDLFNLKRIKEEKIKREYCYGK